MRFHNVLIAIIFAIGVVRCQIDWEHLTAQQLGQISADVFTTITVDQFTSIPIQAFRGWKTEQVNKIPADVFHHVLPGQLSNFGTDACKGFTVDQMNLPGDLCNNFKREGCFENIPPSSFAGFSSYCLYSLPDYFVDVITAAQFSNIRLDSLSGLQACDNFHHLRTEIFTTITPAQLKSLSGYGCCMIDERMHLMKDETLQAVDAHCMENLGFTAFRNITLNQFNLFSPDALHTLRSSHVEDGNKTLWLRLSLEQLTDLSSAAWSAFAYTDNIFTTLLYTYGKNLIDILNAAQLSHFDIGDHQMTNLKEEIYNHFSKGGPSNMYSWDDVKHELHVANWLKILLIDEGENNFAHHFTSEVLAAMQGLSTVGIRGIIFGQIDPTAFSAFNEQGIQDLTRDQIGNMTADQWNNITLAQLSAPDLFLSWKVRAIPVSVVPHILPSHMAALEHTFGWDDWSCPQIYAITAEQLAAFTEEGLESYNRDLEYCEESQRAPSNTPKAVPIPTPIAAEPSSQSTHPQSSPSSAALSPSTLTGTRSIGTSGVFAIVLGCVAGLEASVIGYYFYRKRRVNAVKYRSLQASDN